MFRRKSLVAAIGVVTLSLSATAVMAGNVLLKTPIAFNSSLPALGTPIVKVADQLPQRV